MEMFYPSPRLRMIRERLLYLATSRYGMAEQEAVSLVDGFMRGDSEIDTEEALAEIRSRGAAQNGAPARASRLLTHQGLGLLRLIREAQATP